jgi:hypothetical protein
MKVLSPHQTINLNKKLRKNKIYGYLQTYGIPATPDITKSTNNLLSAKIGRIKGFQRPKTSSISIKKQVSSQKLNNFRSNSETNLPVIKT